MFLYQITTHCNPSFSMYIFLLLKIFYYISSILDLPCLEKVLELVFVVCLFVTGEFRLSCTIQTRCTRNMDIYTRFLSPFLSSSLFIRSHGPLISKVSFISLSYFFLKGVFWMFYDVLNPVDLSDLLGADYKSPRKTNNDV